MTNWRLRLLGALWLVAACTNKEESHLVGPSVVAIDSTRLEETDSIFLSFPTTVIAAPAVGIFVGDAASGKILRYDAHGRLIRAYARKGRGPGEFTVPGAMALVDDLQLAVADWQTEEIQWLNLSNGIATRRLPTAGLPYTVIARNDTMFLGTLGRGSRRTSGGIIAPNVDSLSRFGRVPPEYGESPGVRTMHPYVSLALSGGHIVTGFTGSNILFDSMVGSGLRAFAVPSTRRRSMPNSRAMVARFSGPLSDSLVAGMGSTLIGAFGTGKDTLFLVHLDVVLSRQLLTADAWVSVVDLASDRGCVDTRIRTSKAGKPIFTVIGDTLIMLEQRLTSSNRPETWVVRYRVDTKACDWLPLLSPDSAQ